jgi:hypothetical protein
MKLVKVFSSETEVKMAAGLLQSQNIFPFINGAKDYTAHVLGGSQGRYELSVPPEEFEKASTILSSADLNLISVNDDEALSPEDQALAALKKSIYFSLLAGVLIIPLIFNYYSLKQASVFYQFEKRPFTRLLWMSLIIIINSFSLALWGYYLHNYLGIKF